MALMAHGVRWRLSAMMFMQYMVWGAWYPVFSAYLEKHGFTGFQIGMLYGLLPIGCMIAPFIGGQLADRYFSTELLLTILHISGGIVLLVTARVTQYQSLLVLMFIWSLVYAPTLALSNSITFHHLPSAEKKFGLVRVFGTLGWIFSGLLLTLLRTVLPETSSGMAFLGGADSLWLGGAISILLGIFCMALPATPPARSGQSPWAFLAAFKLLRDRSFLLFIIVSFIVATELMFYYVLTAPFLQTLGISAERVPAVMTIAQIAEIGAMLALPFMIDRWGIRWTMTVGILAWPIRYAVFAFGEPTWLVVAALSLHGICYVCFFVVSYIYVNSVAPADIRASAQAFITFVTLGAGLYLGSIFAGWIRDYFTTPTAINYTAVFLVPCALTVLCAILFLLTFRENPETAIVNA
ncbi:MAG: MFS transporter [Pyrinomonadaceae bacterium]